MSNRHVKYLLVGAGLTSVSAARAIREIDRETTSAIERTSDTGRPLTNRSCS